MLQIDERFTNVFLMTATLIGACVFTVPAAAQSNGSVRYVLCIQGVSGPGVGSEFPDCIEVLALGFSVEREMADSSVKGGTLDINIGVGEISPVSVRKPSDGTSPLLFSYAVNGNSMGNAEIFVLEERPGWPTFLTTMEVTLERSFVRSLRLDPDDLVETLELHFNKIQLRSYERDSSGKEISSSQRCWDPVKQMPCSL